MERDIRGLFRAMAVILLLLLGAWVLSHPEFLVGLEVFWKSLSHLLAVLCLLGVGVGIGALVLFVIFMLRH